MYRSTRRCWLQTGAIGILAARTVPGSAGLFRGDGSDQVLDIGSRLELFVDHHLIDRLTGVRLKLHSPRDRGPAISFDKSRPWEWPGQGYFTVLQNGRTFQAYYRGKTGNSNAGNPDEVTCYAESTDGIHWVKPHLGLFRVHGTFDNNVVLDNSFAPACSNFAPFLDTRPGVPAGERYKALGGTFPFDRRRERDSGGLLGFVSADGIRWRKLREAAVIDSALHPAKNVDTCQSSVFWSVAEGQYICYVRIWKNLGREGLRPGFTGDTRWIGRTTSPDFLNWTPIQMMEYQHDDGTDQLYLPNTYPYFRAPHIYLAITARLSDYRQVLTSEEAKAAGIPKHSWKDTSDVIFMTSRGGLQYNRVFRSSYIRPGLGTSNWASRGNFPALGCVQTSPTELSLYITRNYMTPRTHLHRYGVRLDGFASVNAPYEGGELITKPLRFVGNRLKINFSTSASGWIRCEIQDRTGRPIDGFKLADCVAIGGDAIERLVSWIPTNDLSRLAGQPVRIRFVMKDADLFSIGFTERTVL